MRKLLNKLTRKFLSNQKTESFSWKELCKYVQTILVEICKRLITEGQKQGNKGKAVRQQAKYYNRDQYNR